MANPGAYYVGQQIQVTATFRNVAEEVAEPTTVYFEVLDGERNLTRYNSPAKLSLGVWTLIITATIPGTWRYRAVGTGNVTAAAWKTFGVEPEAFTFPE